LILYNQNLIRIDNTVIECLLKDKEFVKEVLLNTSISFAFISGKYEIDGSLDELNDNSSYKPDIDIIVFGNETLARKKLISLNFKVQSKNTFLFKNKSEKTLNIDIYFNWISFGVVKIFKPNPNKILNNQINDYDYLFYQTLEPLLKFGGYKKRHLVRLKKYEDNLPLIHLKIKKKLFFFCFPLSYLIKKARCNRKISSTEHFLLKVLFIIKPRNFINYIQFKYFKK